MTLSRRHLLFCAPAVILTPGLLMPVKPMIALPRLWRVTTLGGYDIEAENAMQFAKMLCLINQMNSEGHYPFHATMHTGDMKRVTARAVRREGLG